MGRGWRGLEIAVLPQLSLTLTNAVIVTASLSRTVTSGPAVNSSTTRAKGSMFQSRHAL
jgi:hypothetical protein